MALKCLIVYANELLGLAVESLFLSQNDIEVKSIPANQSQLIQKIKFYQPELLLVEEDIDPVVFARILLLPLNILKLQLIGFSFESNSLHIYQKEEVPINTVSDFFSIIYRESFDS